MNEIVLEGCTPEPLMGYLKALGVFRIIAKQKDPDVKGCWRDGFFMLSPKLNKEEITDFFINSYKPTPVVVPWSGGDFFSVASYANVGIYNKTPTASKIIEAFLRTSSDRLADYRTALSCALSTLCRCGISRKKDLENKKLKLKYIAALRNVSLESVIDWIDTCAVLTTEKTSFSALLGSGGGSDGNTHFSDNFMQNLWEVLPDFDSQRKKPRKSGLQALENALWGIRTSELVPDRTSSLYDAGASGGANAGQGFERNSIANPWNFILCLEGSLLLSGAISRRQGAGEKGRAAFPFQVRLTSTRLDSSSDKETSGREIWLPIWAKWTTCEEIAVLFTEGRASVGSKAAERGVDFARAAVSLGVERGIQTFHRYAIVKGRIGGDNYNTAAPLGRFEVTDRPAGNLLRQIDQWLDRFRPAASDDKAPPRFRSALRRIESAIFSFCQYGGAVRFAEILCTLGYAERHLALTKGKIGQNKFNQNPITGLSPEWLEVAWDGSVEFEIALALADIYDTSYKIGPLRANLEPVKTGQSKQGITFTGWADSGNSVVWNAADLARNLAAVLERRCIDGERAGCEALPLASRSTASLEAIAAFIGGETDDERIDELLWGLLLIENSKPYTKLIRTQRDYAPPLPRAYALLKLLFLPQPLKTPTGEITIRSEPAILQLIRAGRSDESCANAMRRLRARGLLPMPHRAGNQRPLDCEWQSSGIDPMRIAAALLFPISRQSVETLKRLILRPQTNTNAVAE